MKLEASTVPGGINPNAPGPVAEHVTALMTLGGLKAIVLTRYMAGHASWFNVTYAFFEEAPEEVRAWGIVTKDAIAQIMASASISRISIEPTMEEMSGIRAQWAQSMMAAKAQRSAEPAPEDAPAAQT